MRKTPLWMVPAHLAPGDSKSLGGDWSGLELHRVASLEDPFFDMAFGALWAEFGVVGEMEHAAVLEQRMRWNPAEMRDGASLQYALLLLTHAGKFVAVRDHTVILLEDEPGAVVHLSHNLVAPEWRRSGIAGWLRALPVSTALDSLKAMGRAADSPITLVAEMEHFDPHRQATWVRLTAYEKAGFKMVDPSRVNYLQPDFRYPRTIDLEGGAKPLPLCLMLRRAGREGEGFVTAEEVLRAVRGLYKMYATGFRSIDMKVVYESLETYPGPGELVALVPPTRIALPPTPTDKG